MMLRWQAGEHERGRKEKLRLASVSAYLSPCTFTLAGFRNTCTLNTFHAYLRVMLPAIIAVAVGASTTLVYAQRSDEILLQAGKFVVDMSNQLSGVIADESYQQELYAFPLDGGIRPRIRERATSGEALFLWLPTPMEWMFVRNVQAVDGRQVPDSGERLDRLFKESGLDKLAYLRQLQEENARFDLGPVVRTLGDPTFALRYLEPGAQPRFEFSRAGTERIGGARASVFFFRERRRPYIVKVNGTDGQSTGTMWIDATDGAVLRTSLRVMLPSGRGTAALITVEFVRNGRLGVWVPFKMSERYNSASGETTTGSASYVNFRRFDTSVRVTTPEAPN